MNVVEAGRKGGLTVLRKLGREFYSQIGRKGQAVTRQRYPSMAKQWGKLGGRPRKNSLNDLGE
jgi:general stress protein YciG